MNADPMHLGGAVALVIIGFFVLLKGGSKWGFLIIAAAIIWGWSSIKPVIQQAQPGQSTPEQNRRGYYR